METLCKIANLLAFAKKRRLLTFLLSSIYLSSCPAFADGLDQWEFRNPLPTGNTLFGITFGKDQFVAVGENSDGYPVLTSVHGKNWTRQSCTNVETLRSVAFGHETFCAVGDAGAVVTS